MRKLLSVLVLAAAIHAIAWADASQKGCEHSGDKAKGCAVAMPEASALPELLLGLGVVGSLVVRQQKSRKKA